MTQFCVLCYVSKILISPTLFRNQLFFLQCGIDLVNEEARGKKQGSLSKDGTAPRKKRESRVQSFGWNQVQCTHAPLVPALCTQFVRSLHPRNECFFTGCPTGSHSTINGPERRPSAKKCRRRWRFLAHGRKRREPCRARHGGSFVMYLVGLEALATTVHEQHRLLQ